MDGIIDGEAYKSILSRYSNAITEAKSELQTIISLDSDKKTMLKHALSIVDNLGNYYREVSHKNKIQLLGSIFPEMVEFDGNKCRTPRLNEAVRLCLSADKGYSKNKNWKPHEKLEVSSWVEPEGFEPSSKQQTCEPSTCLFSS
jgi:site-specific DNA recombinase